MIRRPGITVLIPTSPIPSHPSTAYIDEAYRSVRAQLPDVPVVIAADGYHEGACSREDYEEYLQRIEFGAPYRTTVVRAPEWLHEANLTRLALPYVETDLVLFVEHDYALVGDIPWPELSAAIRSDVARMIRLSMEPAVPEPWRYLYLEPDDPVLVEGVPLLRTVQWSTRPYLADTDWLERIHETYVGDGARHFVETVLHAVLYNEYRERGEAGWRAWRLWTYAPAGDMTRFLHLDGRGDAPTRPVTVSYPTAETPEYAPAPVSEAIQ